MIRPISHHEIHSAALVLAKAFQNDPFISWVVPQPHRRMASSAALWNLSIRYALSEGVVVADESRSGVAIAFRPGYCPMNFKLVFRKATFSSSLRLLRAFGLLGMIRLSKYGTHIHRHQAMIAPMPHWYLYAIGVLPEKWGLGIGKALLNYLLHGPERKHFPWYLETTNNTDVKIYSKFHFVAQTDEVIEKELRLTTMLRLPASSAEQL